MDRRTSHLRAARLFESPAVASHPLRQRFRFRTANVKYLDATLGVPRVLSLITRHVSLFLSIFTIFALRPSSSLIQSPMSAASSALPRGEIQLTASRSKLSSSTPTIVNVSVAPFLSFAVTVAPNVTLLDAASG